jgi:cytochrome c
MFRSAVSQLGDQKLPNINVLAARCRRGLLIACLAALTCVEPASAASLARGRILFLLCASCHDISTHASPKTGPNLLGVIGRKAGSLPGYDYSTAMKKQSFVWDKAALERWLKAPNAVVPGTAMAFEGLRRKSDRDAVIDYLISKGG